MAHIWPKQRRSKGLESSKQWKLHFVSAYCYSNAGLNDNGK